MSWSVPIAFRRDPIRFDRWYKTYPPRTSRMAENAIAKLEEYKERRKLEA
jgi:hypothetical protein